MTSSLRFPPTELARILTGFFTLRLSFGFVPNVEPSLDRLQIAGLAEKIKLFHVASFVHADMLFFFHKSRTPIVP